MSLNRKPQKHENKKAFLTFSRLQSVAISCFISSMVKYSRVLSGTLILSVLAILVFSTLFVGCWCPVGNPWDYEDIEDNSAYYQAPYTLSSGKAYHAEAMLRNNPYGCGNSFVFKAEADVHCQFAVKFYHSKNELEAVILPH